jgi:tetratricopeptide (TPR) repeat protein
MVPERRPGTHRALWGIAVFVVFWAGCGGKQTTRVDAAVAGPALQASFEHYNAGRYREAIAAAKTALSANPNLPDAYSNMAVSYLALRKYDEGIQAAQEAIRLRPDYELAKNNLAWIQREKAKASAPAPPLPPAQALLNQSLQHAQAGRFRECMDTAKQSAALDPKSAGAFNNAGFCAGKLQLWDEAIRNMQAAIRLDPNNQLAKNNLAAIEQQKAQAGKSK